MKKFEELSFDKAVEVNGGIYLGYLVTLGLAAGAAGYAAASCAFEKGQELGKSLAQQ